MDKLIELRGSGGGGGDGGISEEPDNLSSISSARFIDLISEGPIVGLVRGSASIFVDGVSLTTLIATDGITPYTFDQRLGTQTQTVIQGFAGTQAEVNLGLKILYTQNKVIRSVPDSDADAVRFTVGVQGLTSSGTDGKVSGNQVTFKLFKRRTVGLWVECHDGVIVGKTTSRYQRTIEVPLSDLGPGPYEVAVQRMTVDSASALSSNDLYWDSYTVSNYEQFTYPNSALVAMTVDGRYFSNVPARSYHVRGLLVQVPVNYNPVTRVYATIGPGTTAGAWDGTFKRAYTDNPAWCYYDLCTNNRYGIGDKIIERVITGPGPLDYVDVPRLNKWDLYKIAKSCDVLVPTGRISNNVSDADTPGVSTDGETIAGVGDYTGSAEPRFRLNCVINTREKAMKVLNQLTSVFWGMSYWGSDSISLVHDTPTVVSMLYHNGNVEGGVFTYEGSSREQRMSVALVGWNDPKEDFRQKIEYIEDRVSIARYGVRSTEIVAFGCTSRSQARRLGLWLLLTQRTEMGMVKFKVGSDSAFVMPGAIVQVMDSDFSGVRWGGRLFASTTTNINLDVPVTLDAGAYTLTVIAADGKTYTRTFTLIASLYSAFALTTPLPTAPTLGAPWTLASATVTPRLVRVVTVRQDGHFYEVTGVDHNPSKYAAIELGVGIEEYGYTQLSFDTVPAVTGLSAVESTYPIAASRDFASRLEVSWDRAKDPTVRGYVVAIAGSDKSYTEFPESSVASVTLENAQPLTYMITVRAVNMLGRMGPATKITSVVDGVDDRAPPTAPTPTVTTDGANFYVTWTNPTYFEGGGHLRMEVYVSGTNNSATAALTGSEEGGRFVFGTSALVPRYVWLKSVARNLLRSAAFSGVGSNTTPAIAAGEITPSPGWINTNVTVGADGTLLGAGGGQVTLAGVGFKQFRALAVGSSAGASAPGTTGLYLNGLSISGSGRSWVLNKIRRLDGVVVFSQVYDVFTSTANASALAAELNSTGGNYIVVIRTHDEPQANRLSGGLAAAMYRCGASRSVFGSTQFKYRSAYILVGLGGCGEGNGAEAYQGSVDDDINAWCDMSFAVVGGNLTGVSGTYRPRTLADYSYVGDLNATVGAPTGTNVGGTPAQTVESNAATALANAANAQNSANTANAALAEIASDAKLTPVEKSQLRLEWDALVQERTGVLAQATSLGVSVTSYNNGFIGLGTYLNAGTTYAVSSTPPLWLTDAQLSVTVDIVAATFRTTWGNFYTDRQGTFNAIAAAAALVSAWAGVSGRPANIAALSGNEAILNSALSLGAVSGTLIAAQVPSAIISTRTLLVMGAGASLWPDTNYVDLEAWQVASWGTLPAQQTLSDGVAGTTSMRATNALKSARAVRRIPVVIGKRYRVSAQVRRDATCNGLLYIRVDRDNTATGVYAETAIGIEGLSTTTGWMRYTGEWVATHTFASPMVLLADGATTGWMEAQDIRFEEMVGADLIVDGSITAPKMTAGLMQADNVLTRGLTVRDAAGTVVFSAGMAANPDDSQVLGFNSSFTDWPGASGTMPTGWSDWSGATGVIVKETTITQIGPHAVRFPTTGVDKGLSRTIMFEPIPLHANLTGTIDIQMVTRASGRPGVLIRLFTNAGATSFVDTKVQPGSDSTGVWHRIPFTAEVGVGQQIFGMTIFILASWSGFASGSFTGNVVYDRLQFRFALPVTATQINVTSLSAIQAELGSAVISTTGSLRSGQTGFHTGSGFWLGHVSGVPKLSIGDPSGQYLKWDSTNGLVLSTSVANISTTGPSASISESANASAAGATTAAAYIYFYADGTIRRRINTGSILIVGNWYTPTTTNVGASYWIRFVRGALDGSTPGGTFNSFLALSGSPGVSLLQSATGNSSNTISVTISSTSDGAVVVGSGTVNLFAEKEP